MWNPSWQNSGKSAIHIKLEAGHASLSWFKWTLGAQDFLKAGLAFFKKKVLNLFSKGDCTIIGEVCKIVSKTKLYQDRRKHSSLKLKPLNVTLSCLSYGWDCDTKATSGGHATQESLPGICLWHYYGQMRMNYKTVPLLSFPPLPLPRKHLPLPWSS